MDSNTQFWLGLLLSIPIGIATGLATPGIQRWLESKGKERALRETKRTQQELESVTYFKENPELFTQYLVQVAIKTTFIAALLGIIGGIFFIGGQVMSGINETLFIVGQAVTTLSSVMIVNICRPALSMWTKVRNFEEFKKAVEQKLITDTSASTNHAAGQQVSKQ